MNILDIIILICCIPILISGYKKGFISQAVSIIALMAGVWVASALGEDVGSWFLPIMEGNCDDPQNMANLAGFAVTLVVTLVIVMLLGKLVGKIILWVVPDVLDKGLGLILSAVNGIILFCTLYMIFTILNRIYMFTDMKGAFFSDSVIFPMIESTTNTLLPNFLNMFI